MIDISPALSRTEEMVTEMGGEFLSCVGDVQDETAMENFINTVIEVYGRIDVLNNNAGIVVVKPLEDTKFEEFERVAKVNIGGTFVLTKLVLPMMKQQKEGSIVNLGSISGHVGQTEHAIYGATKGAVIAFTSGCLGGGGLQHQSQLREPGICGYSHAAFGYTAGGDPHRTSV